MNKKIFIQNKAYLHYSNNSLLVENDTKTSSICLDDIDCIVIEHQRVSISNALLAKLSASDICVIFIDEKYKPSGILQGLNKNSRTTKIQKAQVSIPKTKHNKLWQGIVKNKLKNQAWVLKKHGKNYQYLENLAKQVRSNDSTNAEAVGASYYFKELFGVGFLRKDEEDVRNILLNYGYTIFRSSIARHIVSYGLNPVFGIFHKSELNAFSLADDIIEPFRPIVDDAVANLGENLSFGTQEKLDLLMLLEKDVRYQEKTFCVNEVMKRMVASYQSVCLEKANNIEQFALHE